MRSELPYYRGFVAGLLVGLALAGVALLTAEAGRRARTRRRLEAPHEAERGPRPGAEVSYVPRLRSEAPDVPPLSQRW